MTDLSAIIDQIYEAAFLPDTWYTILDHMAAATGAQGTSLVSTIAPSTKWLASPSLEDMKIKMIDEGWYRYNTRTDKLLSIEHHGFVNEADFFTEHDYNTMPIFTGMMQPLGYGFGTSTFISTPSGEKIIVAVEKKKATGPVEQSAIAYLDQLRPHLARAAMMSSRLEFERVNAAVEALQLANLPSAMLRHDGRMIAGNRLLEEFAPQVTIAARDIVRFDHTPANTLLAEALESARAGTGFASRSFPLPRSGEAPPAVVHLVPVRGSARDIFLSATFFLIVTPVDRSRVPTAETIQGLFDLTPAEARVARALATGRDVAATAEQLAVSTETVRSHVKSILLKSGMPRQTDFVAAVASVRSLE